MMTIIHFLAEAQQLADQHAPVRLRNRFVTADGFDIDLYVFHSSGEGRLHTCDRDEFFYVLRGQFDIQIATSTHQLRQGEGLNVKAGIKHKHTASNDTWVMVVSKWPHKHGYYD
jgi:quercetin dioxygenase-like cupin family protein